MKFSQKMPLYLFYTMVQKVKNDQKLKSRGVGSCLKKPMVPHPFEFANIHTVNERSSGGKPYITNQSVASSNDWPQHAASCHILAKLAAIMIKVGALLQVEGPWFFTLFSREEPPCLCSEENASNMLHILCSILLRVDPAYALLFMSNTSMICQESITAICIRCSFDVLRS